jgi:hypothetical protein
VLYENPTDVQAWQLDNFCISIVLFNQSAFPQATTYSITPNPATVSESAGTLLFTISR